MEDRRLSSLWRESRGGRQRYLAISGILTEVGGSIFDTSSKNTIRASKMEIHMVIFSPASAGR